MSDPRFEPASPVSEVELAAVEQELGQALPEDYREFVLEYGGAFVGGLVDGDESLPILQFFGAGDASGILPQLRIHTDLRDEGILPIGDCELGNLYVIDRDGSVSYIDYYGSKKGTKKVCNSFKEFLSRIVVDLSE